VEQAFTILKALADPRGRCNRKGLVVAAAVMLSVEVIVALGLWTSARRLDDPAVLPLKVAMVYLAISAASQRLHDLGRSAWSILWALLALIGWSLVLAVAVMLNLPPEQLAPGERGHMIVFAGVAVPLVAALLWLHFAPGKTCANRFGPVPTGLGFARSVRAEASEPVAVAA
jgi:uncharacterized membrane protein YhaH (DUF805 family)